MQSVLKNPPLYRRRRVTNLQRQYLQSRTTDRKRVIKHEQKIQVELCDWFKQVLPGEHFISDTGSGAFNSEWAKEQHNRQQSHRYEPDVKILAARHGKHGLLIELKRDGFKLKMSRDGHKIRLYKDKKGRIIDAGTKVRKKGDWVSLHIERQAAVLLDYESKGYVARFAVGLEHAKKLVRWYFDLPDEVISSSIIRDKRRKPEAPPRLRARKGGACLSVNAIIRVALRHLLCRMSLLETCSLPLSASRAAQGFSELSS